MFKWLSRSGLFIQAGIFLALGAMLWVPAFMHPAAARLSVSDGPLYSVFAESAVNFPELAVALSAMLVAIESVTIFYIFHVHQFFGRSNFIPAIVALLAFSWNPEYLTLHAVLVAGLFVLLALHLLLMMFGRAGAVKNVFTASFLIGIASLIYTPMAFMLLLVWFTLISYRISAWREYAVSLLGFVVPYVYYASGLFWNNNLLYGWSGWVHQLFPDLVGIHVPGYFLAWLIISALVMTVTLFVVLYAVGDRVISLRRKSWVLFNFSVAALFPVLISGFQVMEVNSVFAAPFAFAISGSLFMMKKPFRFEILAILYLVAFVLFRVMYFISF